MLRVLLLSLAVAAARSLTVITTSTSDLSVRLAAAEVRRYLYDVLGAPRPSLATVASPTALSSLLSAGPAILLLNATEAATFAPSAAAPATPGYALSRPAEGATFLLGSDNQHVLYAAYSYLEALGFTFTSAGPTVPARSQLRYPPVGWVASAAPSFSTRGLQPFHDFAEGYVFASDHAPNTQPNKSTPPNPPPLSPLLNSPDWWGEDEVKRVTEAILSMKGNLIGFHTYPLLEPAVWVGLKGDVAPDGTVANPATAYSTRWATTHEPGGAWGYNALDTSKFGFGASQIFEHECFGHESVSGDPALCPEPAPGADAAELFNRVGALWKATFAHAVALGVGTVLGTEIPLAMPAPAPPAPPGPGATLPLQLWYSMARNDHFVTTTPCAECDGLYTLLGVTGWVYANNETGSTPLCTYAKALPNGQIDNELRACRDGAAGAVRIEGFAPAGGAPGTDALFACTNPDGHHWAANSNWSALAERSGFVCTPGLAPAFTSGPPLPAPQDAQDYYEGIFTRLMRLLGNNLTYYWGWTPEGWEWDKVPVTSPLIQDAVVDTQKMQAAHDAVQPPFALASCGWTVGPLGARWYYDTKLPSSWTISSIDMDVGNTPVDPAYANITHRPPANKWAIPWAVSFYANHPAHK